MKNQSIILTAKDEEILNLRRIGNTNKEVASKVYLSIIAVKKRLSRLRQKAGVKNDTALIDFCHEQGLFSNEAA